MTEFWIKVQIREPGDCWPWQGTMTKKNPYGRFGQRRAPRVAWELQHGKIPDGLCVLHKCDNPACVNPDHLFLGTRADNNADMQSKGRNKQPGLENNGRSKLTNEQALEIRRRAEAGEKRCDLAAEFGLSAVAVSYLCIGKNWKSLSR